MKAGKIKILDIIFVILLAIFLVIVFKQKSSKDIDVADTKVVLAIEADETEVFNKDVPKVGDKVIDKRRNTEIGVVKDIQINDAIDNPMSEYTGIENGREKDSAFISMRFLVNSKANIKDDGIYVDGFNYLLGDELTLTIGDLQIYAKIKNLEVNKWN